MDSSASSSKDLEVPTTRGVPVDLLPGPVASGSDDAQVQRAQPPKRGAGFWLLFISICVSIFLSALDLASVSTALPRIVSELNGETSFAWVGSAYTLAAAAWLPLSGALANSFGRQPVMLVSLVLFFIGSVVCSEATSMNMLITGRTVQGLGSGGVTSLAEIIVADLVPLRERGLFQGLMALTWAFAGAMGPPIGGAFAQKSSWRWLFRLNLAFTFIAFCLVIAFLKLKAPTGSVIQKLRKIDWWGNLLVIAATCAVTIALTRGGVNVSWASAQTLVPLILGFLGIIAFFVYEARWAADPTIPFDLLSNRTSVSGYVTTFFHSVIATTVIFFLPVYFQACMGAGPIQAGINAFGFAFSVAPAAVVSGIGALIMKRYVPQNYIGWVLTTIGVGLLSLLRADTSTATWVGFEVIVGIGLGLIWTAVKFPILAPLPVSRNASAMALFVYGRSFAQTFGITIGSAVLQNQLNTRLPADFLALFPAGVVISFAAIPYIPALPQPVRGQVEDAFATSLATLWKVMLAFCAGGVLAVLLMREIEMHGHTDEHWDLSTAEGAAGRKEGTAHTASDSSYAPNLEHIEMEKGVESLS